VISDVPYVIKSNLQGVKLYGWLPIATQKDNLAQVLFAVGATIKSDLDGILHIEGLWDGVSGSSSKDEMYEGPNVDYASLVTGVSVTEHQYFTGGESVTLFEGTTTAGDIITFSDPMYNLEATGFTILESNANYAKVSAGSGTLTGNKYIHNTREVTASVSSSSSQNVKTVKDATLVSLVNSRAVAERLANYYKCIQEINADVVYGGEKPGDILSTWHPYDKKNVPSCVKSVDITVSNTLKATETIVAGLSNQYESLYPVTQLPANTDLDTVTAPGVYYAASADISTILNLPDNFTGYIMLVVRRGLYSTMLHQEIYNWSGASTFSKFWRSKTSSADSWTEWIEEFTPVVSPPAVPALPFSLPPEPPGAALYCITSPGATSRTACRILPPFPPCPPDPPIPGAPAASLHEPPAFTSADVRTRYVLAPFVPSEPACPPLPDPITTTRSEFTPSGTINEPLPVRIILFSRISVCSICCGM
jgi:hypothetical protein